MEENKRHVWIIREMIDGEYFIRQVVECFDFQIEDAIRAFACTIRRNGKPVFDTDASVSVNYKIAGELSVIVEHKKCLPRYWRAERWKVDVFGVAAFTVNGFHLAPAISGPIEAAVAAINLDLQTRQVSAENCLPPAVMGLSIHELNKIVVELGPLPEGSGDGRPGPGFHPETDDPRLASLQPEPRQ